MLPNTIPLSRYLLPETYFHLITSRLAHARKHRYIMYAIQLHSRRIENRRENKIFSSLIIDEHLLRTFLFTPPPPTTTTIPAPATYTNSTPIQTPSPKGWIRIGGRRREDSKARVPLCSAARLPKTTGSLFRTVNHYKKH